MSDQQCDASASSENSLMPLGLFVEILIGIVVESYLTWINELIFEAKYFQIQQTVYYKMQKFIQRKQRFKEYFLGYQHSAGIMSGIVIWGKCLFKL